MSETERRHLLRLPPPRLRASGRSDPPRHLLVSPGDYRAPGERPERRGTGSRRNGTR